MQAVSEACFFQSMFALRERQSEGLWIECGISNVDKQQVVYRTSCYSDFLYHVRAQWTEIRSALENAVPWWSHQQLARRQKQKGEGQRDLVSVQSSLTSSFILARWKRQRSHWLTAVGNLNVDRTPYWQSVPYLGREWIPSLMSLSKARFEHDAAIKKLEDTHQAIQDASDNWSNESRKEQFLWREKGNE